MARGGSGSGGGLEDLIPGEPAQESAGTAADGIEQNLPEESRMTSAGNSSRA